MKKRFLIAGLVLGGSAALQAMSLTESTFTEVIKDVNVVSLATQAAQPARVQEIVKAPDLVRTGPDSRAELTAPDQTITRIGANAVFSFEPAGRNIDLRQGSILFHSPAGKGGGAIHSGGASAAVLGTTIIVSATPNGGFKIIVLEGKGKATLPNGKTVRLKEGQLVFVLPGQNVFGPLLDINLEKLVSGSLLVNGFSTPLSSQPLIHNAIRRQKHQLSGGGAEDTGVAADSFAGGNSVGNGPGAIDDNTYITLILPHYPPGSPPSQSVPPPPPPFTPNPPGRDR
jgi:hypothetical protein